MSAMSEVLQQIPEEDRNMVTLATYRMMNTVGGRPSDCARSQVRLYLMNRDEFIAVRDREREADKRVRDLERAYIGAGLINLDTVGL
jgi:hypothetical protein